MENLKKYIMYKILNKEEEIEENKYNEVINLLNYKVHNDDIISYIMRSALEKIVGKGINPTNNTILDVLTTTFCVDKAYEYARFLQNFHEHESSIYSKVNHWFTFFVITIFIKLIVNGNLKFDDPEIYPGHKSVSAVSVRAEGDGSLTSYKLTWNGINTFNTELNYYVYKSDTEITDLEVNCKVYTKIIEGKQYLTDKCVFNKELGDIVKTGLTTAMPYNLYTYNMKNKSWDAMKSTYNFENEINFTSVSEVEKYMECKENNCSSMTNYNAMTKMAYGDDNTVWVGNIGDICSIKGKGGEYNDKLDKSLKAYKDYWKNEYNELVDMINKYYISLTPIS